MLFWNQNRGNITVWSNSTGWVRDPNTGLNPERQQKMLKSVDTFSSSTRRTRSLVCLKPSSRWVLGTTRRPSSQDCQPTTPCVRCPLPRPWPSSYTSPCSQYIKSKLRSISEMQFHITNCNEYDLTGILVSRPEFEARSIPHWTTRVRQSQLRTLKSSKRRLCPCFKPLDPTQSTTQSYFSKFSEY